MWRSASRSPIRVRADTSELDHEAVAMALKSEELIEAVRFFTPRVAGQRELVASRLGTTIHRVAHHRLADTSLAMSGGDHHILDDRVRTPSVRQAIDDDQGESPHPVTVAFGDEDAVIGIPHDLSEPHLRLGQRQ